MGQDSGHPLAGTAARLHQGVGHGGVLSVPLQSVELRPTVLPWLLARAQHQFPASWPSPWLAHKMAAYFLKAAKEREKLR